MALTQIKTSGLADDAVTTDKLANAINTARDANTAKVSLTDNSVSLAKMAGGTDGQIITYDANGDPVAVGPGSDGQVLTSTGAGSPPAFETLPTSGAALTGSTDNTVVTVTGANAMQGEANLTFDGSKLHTKSGDSGQGSPVVWADDLVVEGSGDSGITILSGNTADASLCFGDDGDADIGRVVYNHNSNFLGFDASAGSRMKVKGDGNVEIVDGNLIVADGHGIDFSATGDTSVTGTTSGAELLDDYEEGQWTPAIKVGGAGNVSISGSQDKGRYVKIGNFVTIWGYFQLSSKGSDNGDGHVAIDGVPYNSDQYGQPDRAAYSCGAQQWGNWSNVKCAGVVFGNNTTRCFPQGGDGTSHAYMTYGTNLNDNSFMGFEISYKTS